MAHKNVLVWGAGQHGFVVAEIARACGHTVLGFIDADDSKFGEADAAGARLLMNEDELAACLSGWRHFPDGVEAIVPAVGDNHLRYAHARQLGVWMAPPLIHPTAYVSPSASVMEGSVVGPMAVVNTGARVGRGVIVNTSGIVGHNVVVEDGAHIGAGVVLTGGCHVGPRTFVATAASLIPGVCIGGDVIVGAGAVVLHDVPDGSVVVGVPAHQIESKQYGTATHLPFAASSVGT